MPQIINLSEGVRKTQDTCDEIVPSSKQSTCQLIEPTDYTDTANLIKEKFPGKILFTVKEIAEELNLSYETIRKFILTNKIRSVIFGTRRMIHSNELTRIITEGVN